MGKHDVSYRRFFSQPRMVKGLLRGFVAEPWVERLDFSSLRRANSSFVSREMHSRDGDLIWSLKIRGGPPAYVCLLLEHQSRVEPFMAVRIMAYEALFYQSLISERELTSSRKLPLVIPIVLYNGHRPWRAARDIADLIEISDATTEVFRPRLTYRVIDIARYPEEALEKLHSPVAELFRIERSGDWKKIQQSVTWLDEALRSPRDRELRQIFEAWLNRVIYQKMKAVPGRAPGFMSLEDLKDMLAERVAAMYRLERMRGRRDGRNEGLLEGRQEGRQQGRQEGRQEGEAELLLRLLERKFGSPDEATRARVRAADPDLLLDWGERILAAERLEDVFGD